MTDDTNGRVTLETHPGVRPPASSSPCDRCCCAPPAVVEGSPPRVDFRARWAAGETSTPAGPVPAIRTEPTLADRLGSWKARWGIGRMRYLVPPGLYAVGSPTPKSPVLVSANYKMSFDRLRSVLSGRNAWIMVLDTRGINVWCAAGKGTFGTEEILRRVGETGLERIVSHRRLVVPQLGATGVSAHEVARRSGFRVIYGPVRAADIPRFLDSGMKATGAMRLVRFPMGDRMALIPMELAASLKYAVPAAVLMVALSGLGPAGFDAARLGSLGIQSAGLLLGAWLSGAVLTPLLLPWLPGRSFSLKGACAGAAFLAGAACFFPGGIGEAAPNAAQVAAWALIVPSMASFLGMSFTGASTFTSLSGVLKEMRVALPLQIGAAAAGLALWIAGLFL